MTFSKTHCILVCLTLYMQEGLFGDSAAHLGKNSHLQRVLPQMNPTKAGLKVTDYHVKCSVVSRYAVTTIQSSVWNQLLVMKEAAFEVDLPSSAFISNFTITSNGKEYVAQVKERVVARKIYDAAKKQGITAGLVATKEREIEKFRVAVSVPSGTRMSFFLTYEELLIRRLGCYELSLGLRPGQLVQNLTLDVRIAERTGLSFVKVLPLKTSRLLSNTAQDETNAPASTQLDRKAGCARVQYSPTPQEQKNVSSKGFNAYFIIQYDVDLTDLLGDVQVHDSYFVHYFAPRGLPVVPKDVIFVIDVSGSMIGTKIKQTKQAITTILEDLREGDHFNIITFSDKVHTWRKGRTVKANRQTIREAKEFVRQIIAEGWTNINEALLSAAQLLHPSSSESSSQFPPHRVPLVIFLTDGEATIGVTSSETILNNAKKAFGSISLFGLAFGDDADYLLLKRLALENRGVARMVYEEADAALQLKGFYNEVASPLLSDIQLSYLDDQAFDVSRSLFPNYFQGSELVVAGRVKPGITDLKVSLSATGSNQHLTLKNNVFISNGKSNESKVSIDCFGSSEGISSFVHRLWAYFTIKELLLAKLNATDPATQRLLTEKATNLSLKYNFVTPVTSLVVVKPDPEEKAGTPTTEKPTTTAMTTKLTTSTASNKIAADFAKQPTPSSNPRVKSKPVTPQPPPNKKSLPTIVTEKVVSPTGKTIATLSPSPIKTESATFPGKKVSVSQNDSKTVPPPPVRKTSTFLLNHLKTAQSPAPGELYTPVPAAMKTAFPGTSHKATLTVSTSLPFISSRTDPAPLPRRAFTQQLSSVKTASPPVKVTGLSSVLETSSKPSLDIIKSETTTDPHKLLSVPSSPTRAPAPAVQDNNINSDADVPHHSATLLSATFAPMPGVTPGPQLWEAAELLEVPTSIQIQEDYELNYDYGYDTNYEGWDDRTDTGSFESPSGTLRILSSSVDGDPHFVVQLPTLHQNLCFTVDGRANDVLRLLEDPEQGIIVDGHLIGAPSKPGAEGRTRTYFDQLTISSATSGFGDIMITLSLNGVVVEGEGRETLPINQQGSVARQGVTVTMDNHRSCWIELARGVQFLVLFHHYKHPSDVQMAHLGFYIREGRGLSGSTQGLLGQFQHADMSVTEVMDHQNPGVHRSNKKETVASGTLRWGSKQMPVTLQDKILKDSLQKHQLGKCWVVPKAEIERLLGHSYEMYVVNHV